MAKITIQPTSTYVNGVPMGHAELELRDESKLWIFADSFGVSVKKRSWLTIGWLWLKLVWKFKVDFSILYNPHLPMAVAIELSEENRKTHTELLLDVVLDSIKDCSTIDEVTARLNQKTTPLLNDYVEQKKMERDVTLDEIGNIISDFGNVLENYACGFSITRPGIIYPISRLPHPKWKIEYAFKTRIKINEIEEKELAAQTGFHKGQWTPEEMERYERPWTLSDYELEAKKIGTYANENEQAKALLIIAKHLRDLDSQGLDILNDFVPDDEFVSRTNKFLELFRK